MLVLVVAGAVIPPSAASAAPRTLDVGRIDLFVSEQVERHGLPGVSLGVVEGAEIVHLRGFGHADQNDRPVTAQTPFLLASTSKPITALAVMQLVEAGRVELDAPVQRYLPGFHFADRRASSQITVRHLLNHTSGMPSTACDTRIGATTLEQYVAELHDVALGAPPGTHHNYCSGNYNVLGRIVEVVTGTDFGGYVRQHVFAPLQMDHSYTAEEPAVADGLAQGYQWFFGAKVATRYDHNTSQLPSGYLISTAEDMSHFLSSELSGGQFGASRVLSSAGMDAMHAPGVDTGKAGTTYGLGWNNGPLAGIPVIHHGGTNYNYHSLLVIEPRSGRGFVLLTNSFGIVASATAYQELEDGLVRLIAGQEPTAARGTTLGTAYLILDAILASILALALWPLLRLGDWHQRARQRQAEGRLALRGSRLRATCELLFPVTLLAVARWALHEMGAQSWVEGLALFPDLGAWLWAIALAMVSTAVLRFILLARLPAQHLRGHLSTANDAKTLLPTKRPSP